MITGVTLFPGVWLAPLVLHISFTRPRANNWGKLFPGSGLIFMHIPFLFLNSVSKITEALPSVSWPRRHWRTKLWGFLCVSFLWGDPEVFTLSSSAPPPTWGSSAVWTQKKFWPPQIQWAPPLYQSREKTWSFPDVLKLPLNSEKAFYTRMCQDTAIKRFWGTENVKISLEYEPSREVRFSLCTSGFLFLAARVQRFGSIT